MKEIIENSKKFFLKTINDFGSDPYKLVSHVQEVENWSKYMLKKHPEINKDVVLISAWLHDIGHYPLSNKTDHAVKGAKIAKKFLLEQGMSTEEIEKIFHCVRSHRCRDILPESSEAKLMAFVDSASHLTDGVYFDIAKMGKKRNKTESALNKIERDVRDLSYFPEEKEDLLEIISAWKNLIKTYDKINI